VILIQNVTAAKIGVSLSVFLIHCALFMFFFILVHDLILPFYLFYFLEQAFTGISGFQYRLLQDSAENFVFSCLAALDS
jgi:hypothetical protein